MNSIQNNSLAHEMLLTCGPLLRGARLYRALGFSTYAGFYRAQKAGELGVRVFRMPGRRGFFCLTTDVAQWVEICANSQPLTSTES